MALYFADTSAIAKRYITEVGSDQIRAICASENMIFVSVLSLPELWSVFSRRRREGSLDRDRYQRLVELLEHDWESYSIIVLHQTILVNTRTLLEKYPLRAADALQLASALHTQTIVARNLSMDIMFLCADDRLVAVAQSEGLLVMNPNRG